jgi:hypothetical protein
MSLLLEFLDFPLEQTDSGSHYSLTAREHYKRKIFKYILTHVQKNHCTKDSYGLSPNPEAEMEASIHSGGEGGREGHRGK